MRLEYTDGGLVVCKNRGVKQLDAYNKDLVSLCLFGYDRDLAQAAKDFTHIRRGHKDWNRIPLI